MERGKNRSSFRKAYEYLTEYHPSVTEFDAEKVLQLCTSIQLEDRYIAVAQLQWLLENEKELSETEVDTVWDCFKKLFPDNHLKILSPLLECVDTVLTRFSPIPEDFLYILLLRLLQKLGLDLTSSIPPLINLILEKIRKTQDVQSQCTVLIQILFNKVQPLNAKSKEGWMDYFYCLTKQMNSEALQLMKDGQILVAKIVSMATEPTRPSGRKVARKVLILLFQLNTSWCMQRVNELDKQLQDKANKILKNYTDQLKESDSEGDSEDTPPSQPLPLGKPKYSSSPRLQKRASSYRERKMTADELVTQRRSSGRSRSALPVRRHTWSKGQKDYRSTTPSNMASLQVGTAIVSNGADHRLNGHHSGNGRVSDVAPPTSHIPTLQSKMKSSRSDHSLSNKQIIKGNPPSNHGNTAKSDYGPKLSNKTRQEFLPKYYADKLALNLEGHNYPSSDHLDRVLRQLTAAEQDSEVHKKALLQLLRLCESPEKYNWKRHCNKVLHILMEQIQGRSSEVKGLALAALREVIKIEPQVLNNVTELVVTKVFKSCRDPEFSNELSKVVKCFATNAQPRHVLPVVIRHVTEEEGVPLLHALELLSKTVPNCDEAVLGVHKDDLMKALLKMYHHSEPSCRKLTVRTLSVTCKVLGSQVDPYLSEMTPVQRRLLKKYMDSEDPSQPEGETMV